MEENGCGGGALKRVGEKKKSPKSEQSEEHGKSLVPRPRILHSKNTHTQCIQKPIGELKAKQKVVINVSSAQEKSYSSFSILNTFHSVV